MKLLAIIDVAQGSPMKTFEAELRSELKGTWELFASGFLREAYLTEKPTRVVFILEAENMAAAEEKLDTLPLVSEGAFVVGMMELKPFANWSKLFATG
jgi:hypothetical protein